MRLFISGIELKRIGGRTIDQLGGVGLEFGHQLFQVAQGLTALP